MDFYVYGHYRKDNGDLFYIGKGIVNRAWSKHGRNSYWHNIVRKHDYLVEILHDSLFEKDAFNKEKELIKSLSPCANIALGGSGGDTWSKLPESQKKKLINDAYLRSQDPNGGVVKATKLRRGQTKETDDGLRRMAEYHRKRFLGPGNPRYGKTFWIDKSEEEIIDIKSRISKTLKETYKKNPRKYKTVKCPHCNNIGAQTGMTRYHFDNCKKKDIT